LALELGKDNVLVNAIAPGFIDTQLTRKNNSSEKISELSNILLNLNNEKNILLNSLSTDNSSLKIKLKTEKNKLKKLISEKEEIIITNKRYSKEYIEHLLASELYGMFVICNEIEKGE
jgi:short-subunit dehydrogenase